MILLPRQMCVAARCDEEPKYGCQFLQDGMGKDAWRVTIASCLLCRTRRQQTEPVLKELLAQYPAAADLARSADLEPVLRPLGMQRNRARQLQRLSSMWHGEAWHDLRDLPGVGKYVADAVGLFVFSCTELECTDHALVAYVERLNREMI